MIPTWINTLFTRNVVFPKTAIQEENGNFILLENGNLLEVE